MLAQGRKQLLEKEVREDKLQCSEEVGQRSLASTPASILDSIPASIPDYTPSSTPAFHPTYTPVDTHAVLLLLIILLLLLLLSCIYSCSCSYSCSYLYFCVYSCLILDNTPAYSSSLGAGQGKEATVRKGGDGRRSAVLRGAGG